MCSLSPRLSGLIPTARGLSAWRVDSSDQSSFLFWPLPSPPWTSGHALVPISGDSLCPQLLDRAQVDTHLTGKSSPPSKLSLRRD